MSASALRDVQAVATAQVLDSHVRRRPVDVQVPDVEHRKKRWPHVEDFAWASVLVFRNNLAEALSQLTSSESSQ